MIFSILTMKFHMSFLLKKFRNLIRHISISSSHIFLASGSRITLILIFNEILDTFFLFSCSFGFSNMTRPLLIIRKTPSEYEFHCINKTSFYVRFEKNLMRLTSYSHFSPPRIQNNIDLIASNYFFPIFYNSILIT